jgi:hypothetical protein
MKEPQAAAVAESMIVRVVEGFVPPAGFIRRVRAALSWIDPADIEGIGFVFLFNQVPPTRPRDNPGLHEALRDSLLLFAAYKARSDNGPAHIMLIVQNICKPIPRVLQRSPALTVWLAENIMHEVGHHVIAERRYVLRPRTDRTGNETEEEFADRFAQSILATRKAYWSYRLGRALLRIAAEVDYQKGVYYWKRGNYELAADQFYLAFQVWPQHSEANHWYGEAKVRTNQ